MQPVYTLKQAFALFCVAVAWTWLVVLSIYGYGISLPFSAEIAIHGGIILLIVCAPKPDKSVHPNQISWQFIRPSVRWVLISILCGVTLWLLDRFIALSLFAVDLNQQTSEWLQMAYHEGIFSSSLAACLLGPLAEELLFRGVILTSLLSSMHAKWAIIISAALFALIHFSPQAKLILFIAGVSFGLLRFVSSSLWPPLIAHITHNTLTWANYLFTWDELLF